MRRGTAPRDTRRVRLIHPKFGEVDFVVASKTTWQQWRAQTDPNALEENLYRTDGLANTISHKQFRVETAVGTEAEWRALADIARSKRYPTGLLVMPPSWRAAAPPRALLITLTSDGAQAKLEAELMQARFQFHRYPPRAWFMGRNGVEYNNANAMASYSVPDAPPACLAPTPARTKAIQAVATLALVGLWTWFLLR